MSIMRLPVDRPVTTVMIFLGVALMGFISWTRVPQELFPSMEYPQITIVTKYEGAGPEEAEKLISKIVEETAGTVKNIKRVSSISKEGTSIVTCEFRWGTNMDLAAMDVREKIDLIKEALPKDSHDPIVLKYNPMQVEAMILSVTYKGESEPDPWRMAELRQFCKKNVKDELERLEGVAKVEIRGGEQKEILVEIDKGRLLANQVSISEIISALQNANITYPAGTIKEATSEYLVKTVGEFQNLGDISALSFGKTEQQAQRSRSRRIRGQEQQRDEKIIYIRDIADVRESLKDRKGYSRYNRQENISLGVYPQSGSNLIRLSKTVHAKLDALADRFPSDVDVKVIYDQSDFVNNALNNIYQNALQGMALSFILLYLFMKSVMGSVIINIAIPVTMLVTLTLMYFGNISINTMSLGGLTVGIGMVVDNSNVVLENILHTYHKYPGKSKADVVFEGTQELISPIISSTLTTVSIFLPLVFVSGVVGQLFKQLAMTITFSMIASIFVALFLVPRMAMMANLDKQSINVGRAPTEKYFIPNLRKLLQWSPKFMFMWLAMFILLGVLAFMLIPKEFMPKVDERRFVLNVTMHPETPLEITNETVRRIEQVIMQNPEIKDLAVSVGSTGEVIGSAAVESMGAYQGRIIARLNRGRKTTEIVTSISDEITRWHIKDLEAEFITQQGLFGSGIGASAGLTVEIKGKDLTVLRARAIEVRNRLADNQRFYGIKVVPSDLVPELKILIDRERASLFGLSTQDISAMTLAAIKGFVATKLKLKDEEFDIRVRMRPEDRDNIDKVIEMTAYSPWGMTIQLKQLAQAVFVKTLPEIRRAEGQRTYLVTANIRGNFSDGVRDARLVLAGLTPSTDSAESIAGEMVAMRESMQSSGFAMVLGGIIIFMILASQFESLRQPFIVMTIVPLGVIGAILSLMATGKSINSISMLGLIMLIGNAVSISIMLVDRYNATIETALDSLTFEQAREMVIGATADHIRPIMMTTLTTIIDLFPMALGLGEGSEATAPMAVAVVGGLSFALVIALFFVPYVYMLFMKGKYKAIPDLKAR